MSTNFDEFPLYDPLVKKGSMYMADVWVSSIATFYQTLITYLTENGIFLPPLTTAQRNAIVSPGIGQMIYNTTTDAPQVYQSTGWKTFTTS